MRVVDAIARDSVHAPGVRGAVVRPAAHAVVRIVRAVEAEAPADRADREVGRVRRRHARRRPSRRRSSRCRRSRARSSRSCTRPIVPTVGVCAAAEHDHHVRSGRRTRRHDLDRRAREPRLARRRRSSVISAARFASRRVIRAARSRVASLIQLARFCVASLVAACVERHAVEVQIDDCDRSRTRAPRRSCDRASTVGATAAAAAVRHRRVAARPLASTACCYSQPVSERASSTSEHHRSRSSLSRATAPRLLGANARTGDGCPRSRSALSQPLADDAG